MPGDLCTALVQVEQGDLSGRDTLWGEWRPPAADTSGVWDCPGLDPLCMKAQIFLQPQREVADPQWVGANPTELSASECLPAVPTASRGPAHHRAPTWPQPSRPAGWEVTGEKPQGRGEALTTGMQLPMICVPGRHLLLCVWGLQWVLCVTANAQPRVLAAGRCAQWCTLRGARSGVHAL